MSSPTMSVSAMKARKTRNAPRYQRNAVQSRASISFANFSMPLNISSPSGEINPPEVCRG